MRQAVAAAADALARWRTVPVAERRALVDAFADGVERHCDELVEIEVRQAGKLTHEVRREVPGLVRQLRAFGSLAETFDWELPEASTGTRVVWEPVGVVASLLPWNAPLNAAARRIAVTVATATTTVIKPSTLGPVSPLRLAEIALEAGVPAGVINVVTGPGEVTGRALLAHPGIAKGSFTGSGETGRDILRRASRRLLPVAAELGGKAPQIVFPDAPWERAQAGVLRGFTRNAGQICTSGTRLLVHASIADRFVSELVDRAAAMRVGPAADPASDMGPQISAAHRDSIDGFVQRARAAGRTIATGGGAAPGAGYFYRPTVVTGVESRGRGVPGGSLRPGARGHAIRDRRGGDRARQRHLVRVRGRASGPRTQPLRRASREASTSRPAGSTRTGRVRPTARPCPAAAAGPGPPTRASRAFASTSSPSRWRSPDR